MKVEYRPIDQIHEAEYNPRIELKPGDPEWERLKRSIEEFSLVEPLVWNERTGNLVGGHQRLRVLKARGDTHVWVSVVDLDPAREKALNLALNKIQGGWDYDKLTALLDDLVDELDDMELTGFDSEELEALLATASDEATMQEAHKDPPQVEQRAKRGDIWELGAHRIACGDCTDTTLLQRLMNGDQAACVVTSPPYAEQRKDKYGGVPADEYPAWFGDVAAAMWTVLKDTGSFFINIKEHVEDGQRHLYVKKLIIAMVEQYGWRFVDELVWVKTGLPGGWNNRLRNDFEPVYWYAKSDVVDVIEREIDPGGDDRPLVDEYGMSYHFARQRKIQWRPKAVGKRSGSVRQYSPTNRTEGASGNISVSGRMTERIARPGNVIRVGPNNEAWGHPAMYPTALAEFFIKLTTESGGLVFDPFTGAGTTLMACQQTGRVFRGTEILPEYVDIVLARWEKATGEEAVLVR